MRSLLRGVCSFRKRFGFDVSGSGEYFCYLEVKKYIGSASLPTFGSKNQAIKLGSNPVHVLIILSALMVISSPNYGWISQRLKAAFPKLIRRQIIREPARWEHRDFKEGGSVHFCCTFSCAWVFSL